MKGVDSLRVLSIRVSPSLWLTLVKCYLLHYWSVVVCADVSTAPVAPERIGSILQVETSSKEGRLLLSHPLGYDDGHELRSPLHFVQQSRYIICLRKICWGNLDLLDSTIPFVGLRRKAPLGLSVLLRSFERKEAFCRNLDPVGLEHVVDVPVHMNMNA